MKSPTKNLKLTIKLYCWDIIDIYSKTLICSIIATTNTIITLFYTSFNGFLVFIFVQCCYSMWLCISYLSFFCLKKKANKKSNRLSQSPLHNQSDWKDRGFHANLDWLVAEKEKWIWNWNWNDLILENRNHDWFYRYSDRQDFYCCWVKGLMGMFCLFIYLFINEGVRVSLCIPWLISRVMKLITM